MIEAVAKQANDYLKLLQVPTRVGVARTKLTPKAFMQELSPNEGVAFIVEDSSKEALEKIRSFNQKFADVTLPMQENEDDVSSWVTDSNIPERSSDFNHGKIGNHELVRGKNVGKNCIAIKKVAVESVNSQYGLSKSYGDVIKGIAYSIVHGAGHNATNLDVKKMESSLDLWEHYGGIMASGLESKLYTTPKNRKGHGHTIEHMMNPKAFRIDKKWVGESERDGYYQRFDNPVAYDCEIQALYSKARAIALTMGAYSEEKIEEIFSQYIKELVYADPTRFPNLTYKFTMGEHFGKHKAVPNKKLGYIPKK